MSQILNLLSLNQRTVALASLGACATIAAYCIYSRKSWSSSKIEEAQREAHSDKNATATVASRTTASSDSGLAKSDGFEVNDQNLLDELPDSRSKINERGRDDSGIVDDCVVAMVTTNGAEAAFKLDQVAGAICPDSAKPVTKEANLDTKVAKPVSKDASLVAMAGKPVAKDAIKSVRDATIAPSLTPQFIEARLRVLSNAPDNANLLLVEGDADVLIKRLLLLSNEVNDAGDAQLVGHLQLIGRLLLATQRAEPLRRGGRLYEALASVYERHVSGSLEIRVRCVLALASARVVNSFGEEGNQVAMATTDLRLAPLLADDAVASDRLRPHALRLLNQLGPACHPLLTGRLPALLSRLRRLGNSDAAVNSSSDDIGFCLIAGLIARILTEPACRCAAFSPAVQLAFVAEFPLPSNRRLRRDVAMRTAWLELLGALASEECRVQLATIWWPSATSATVSAKGSGRKVGAAENVVLTGRPVSLAGAIRAQVPDVYKQVKKLANSMKSSEKKSPPGQRLLAVKKDVKLLKQLAKHKAKVAKKI